MNPNPKYMMLIMVAIAVVCALFAWYKRCPSTKTIVVVEEDPPTPEPEFDESEERLYQYLETESKERTIDIADTVKDLFDVNEVPLNDPVNDPVTFVRTVREWDRSVRKLAQKDAEAMYNNINSLNIDSVLFDTVINAHINPCDTVLFKRILKQLTDDAIKGRLFDVLF